MNRYKSLMKTMCVIVLIASMLFTQNIMAYTESSEYDTADICVTGHLKHADNKILEVWFDEEVFLKSNTLEQDWIIYSIDSGDFKDAWEEAKLEKIADNIIQIKFDEPLKGEELDILIAPWVISTNPNVFGDRLSDKNPIVINNIRLTNEDMKEKVQLPSIKLDDKFISVKEMDGKTITAEEYTELILEKEGIFEEIYYTTDGSTPTMNSSVYTGPKYITKSCTIKLASIIYGGYSTEVVTLNYEILPPSIDYTPHKYIIDKEKYDDNKILELENEIRTLMYNSESEDIIIDDILKFQLQCLMCYTTMDYNKQGDKISLKWYEDIPREHAELICNTPHLASLFDLDCDNLSQKVEFTRVDNPKFKDVPDSHWAAKSIKEASQLGLVKGMPDGTFRPSDNLTYIDTSVFLDRIYLLRGLNNMQIGRDEVEVYIKQHNIDEKHWAFYHIASIVSKLDPDTSAYMIQREDKPITRGILAQIIYESTQNRIWLDEEVGPYVDIENSMYGNALKYCVKAGILKGVDETHMAPDKEVTRAELMTVLIRLRNNISSIELNKDYNTRILK